MTSAERARVARSRSQSAGRQVQGHAIEKAAPQRGRSCRKLKLVRMEDDNRRSSRVAREAVGRVLVEPEVHRALRERRYLLVLDRREPLLLFGDASANRKEALVVADGLARACRTKALRRGDHIDSLEEGRLALPVVAADQVEALVGLDARVLEVAKRGGLEPAEESAPSQAAFTRLKSSSA